MAKRKWAGVFLACVAILCSGCSKPSPTYSECYVMDTQITQQVYGSNAQKACDAVNARLKELESLLSLYVPTSQISKINENAGKSPVKVDDYTFNLLQKGVFFSEQSNGLFDITIAPLSTLWGITSDHPKVPSEEEIADCLRLVNIENLVLDEENRTAFLKEEGMAIDLGGIAKGYFCEEIKAIYTEYEVDSALISIGGNIYTYHQKPDGTSYRLGIRNPLSDSANDLMGILTSHDEVVATTGTYERYFVQDGVRYHHILDLETGYPCDSDLISVTVVSNDGALADALSTTLFLAGKEAIPSYINHSDFSVIVIDEDNRVYVSPSLADRFTIENDTFTLADEFEEAA